MKQPSKVANLARANSSQGVSLTAWDLAQVRAIAATANVRISRRKALSFCGRNATAAEALAERLGRDIVHVDLSAVVSKYIGETEKDLARVFSDAEARALCCFSTRPTRCSESARA